MNENADISVLVRSLWGRTGLTQEEFAARLEVTFPILNRWENGHASPSPLALRQIRVTARGMGEAADGVLSELTRKEGLL